MALLTAPPPLSCPADRRVRALVCILALWAAFAPLRAAGAPDTGDPQQIQAVFLLNLTRFVKWPAGAFPSADAPFVIGVTDNGSLLGALRIAARGEEVAGRPIHCRVLRTPNDLAVCHLVFIESESLAALAPRLPELQRRPILLVSDADGFLHLGGHVQFFTRAGRMRLRIAPDHLERASLQASSQLLRVASVRPNSSR